MYGKVNKTLLILSFLTLVVFFNTQLIAQELVKEYPKGKISLDNGQIITGKNLRVFTDSAVMKVQGIEQEFQLSEVKIIQAKVGKATKWALTCSGGCAALSLGSLLAVGGSTTDAQGNEVEIDAGSYMMGTIIWAGIFYGVGYLIGAMLDDWETIYIK